MNEFDTATIAFQNATIALQNASRAATYWATYVQAGVAGLVGLVQCLLIVYGLRLMNQSNADRQRQADLAEKRHEESMLALSRQGEALRQQGGLTAAWQSFGDVD